MSDDTTGQPPEDPKPPTPPATSGRTRKPKVGDLVRLDNPKDDTTDPAYAFVVGDNLVVDLPAARRHELDTYAA